MVDKIPAHTRWPHIGDDELRRLWDEHAPDFIRLDDVERELPSLRDKFLEWLAGSGVDLGGPETIGGRRRVRLLGVGFVKRGDSAESRVSMSLDTETFEGRRAGTAMADEILRLTAQATLDAVHELVPGLAFGLERAFQVQNTTGSSDPVALVVVQDTMRVASRYVGACTITASAPEAAAKATLQAINRRAETVVARH